MNSQRTPECNPWMRRKHPLLATALGPCAPSESKFPAVSDMSCVDGSNAQSFVCVSRAVSHRCGGAEMLMNSSESFGRSCGKDTLQAPPAQYDTFQLDVFSGVELVSRTTNVRRKRRNWETRQRQSKAHKRAEREAKRKLLAQPEISQEAAARTDEHFPGIIYVSHQLALLHGHDHVFFLQAVWCRQRWRDTQAAEVSVRWYWRISPKSETQT